MEDPNYCTQNEFGFASVSVDDLGFGWKSTKKKWVVELLYRGEIKQNASGLGTGMRMGIRMGLGNKNRVVISYCFRGRPWIWLEIIKMAMGRRVFIKLLRIGIRTGIRMGVCVYSYVRNNCKSCTQLNIYT